VNTVISRAAQRDLTEIREFIGTDNPFAAEQILTRLFDVIEQIAVGDLKGPESSLPDIGPVQSWPVPPYRIYYRRNARRTIVVRVYHQARRSLEL
jgi:plasmid stabilization system protein ParE